MERIKRPSGIEQRVKVAFSAAQSAAGSGAALATALFFGLFGGKAVVLVPAIAFVGAVSALACYAIRVSEN